MKHSDSKRSAGFCGFAFYRGVTCVNGWILSLSSED